MKKGVLLLFLAACQPAARRALVLDLTLTDPALLAGIARPWHDAGYNVEYRRFFPHLTGADRGRYRTLLFLLGREPEGPSDALTTGDLDLLDQWVRGGGVVVLGYAGGSAGSLDRWTVNRWLVAQGAAITIEPGMLEDTAPRSAVSDAGPWVEGRRVGDDPLGSVYEPFPLERNHALSVGRPAATLAAALAPRAGPAVVAAARVDDGLVIVMSRDALAALSPPDRPPSVPLLERAALGPTREFLTALARWTRRPAEWAHVPPAGHPAPRRFGGGPLGLERAPPLAAAPTSVPTVPLPLAAVEARHATNVPPWIRQSGMRALWESLLGLEHGRVVPRPAAAFDSLAAWLDQAGLTLYAGDARPEIVADSLHHFWEERDAVRRAWSETTKQLQPTSVAWIPAFDLGEYRPPTKWADSSRGPRGEAIAAPCPFDSLFWDAGVAPAFEVLARLAGQGRQLVPALALDLAKVPYSMGQEYCDAAWRLAIAHLSPHASLDSLPVTARYRALRTAGLLPRYYGALEDLVAARARVLRDRALRESSGLYFAFRLPQLSGDWFTLGLLRGFSLPDRPLLLFTPEVDTRDVLAIYRTRGLNAVHAVELPVGLLRHAIPAGLRTAAFVENDGFWLPRLDAGRGGGGGGGGGTRSDSLALLLRRLAR